MEQLYHKDFFLDMEEDVEMFDFLSLRRDQCLEHAKEYNSIIPEPLGSRLRPRYPASCLPLHSAAEALHNKVCRTMFSGVHHATWSGSYVSHMSTQNGT